MARPQLREIDCRVALNPVSGMPFRWSLNPYRGCAHGCHYCYARTTHAYLDLDPDGDFSGVILVKRNVAEVLRRELAGRRRREAVAVGTATDPYQPAEGRYRLTRACLEALRDFRTPCWVTTKGPLVVRDADLLAAAGATVSISLPTVDPAVWRRVEPGTAHPRQRLRAVARLRAAGVRVGVLIAPVLPGLTDDADHLRAVARAAADHGAQFLAGHALFLKPGVREHYLGFLAAAYPELLALHRRLYARGPYLGPGARGRIAAQLAAARAEVGLAARLAEVTPPRQLVLPIA
jgi:DNA repair photolyase